MAAPVAGAVLVDDGALHVSLSLLPHFVLNAITLTEPVDSAGLAGAIARAKDHARGVPGAWMLMVCDGWLPSDGAGMLEAAGFVPAMRTTGMAAAELAPRRRGAPEDLAVRTETDTEQVRNLFDVNSRAYGMPLEAGRDSVREGLFSNSWTAVGSVGEETVSVTAVYRVGDCLYVAWVATLPGHEGKGYAETVIRRALEDAEAATGVRRTVLHATGAGQPLYSSMGYEAVAPFTMWVHGLDGGH